MLPSQPSKTLTRFRRPWSIIAGETNVCACLVAQTRVARQASNPTIQIAITHPFFLHLPRIGFPRRVEDVKKSAQTVLVASLVRSSTSLLLLCHPSNNALLIRCELDTFEHVDAQLS